MVNKLSIIQQIQAHKKNAKLNYKLKEDAQLFTKELFHTLFNYPNDLDADLDRL